MSVWERREGTGGRARGLREALRAKVSREDGRRVGDTMFKQQRIWRRWRVAVGGGGGCGGEGDIVEVKEEGMEVELEDGLRIWRRGGLHGSGGWVSGCQRRWWWYVRRMSRRRLGGWISKEEVAVRRENEEEEVWSEEEVRGGKLEGGGDG